MNLAQSVQLARRILVIGVILVTLYLILRISIPLAGKGFRAIFPERNAPTIKWGQLEPLKFVEKPIQGNILSFEINTPNGRLPTGLPEQLPVYKVQDIPLSLEAGRRMDRESELLGFNEDERVTDLKGDIYKWRDLVRGTELQLDRRFNTIEMSTPLRGRENEYIKNAFDQEEAHSEAVSFLRSTGRLYHETYTNEKATFTVTQGKIEDGKIVAEVNPFDTQLYRVDFFRKLLDYPVLGPDPKKGLISLTVGEPAENKRENQYKFPFISYYEWPLVADASGTYPIISVRTAWSAVAEQRKGIVVSVTPRGLSVFDSYTPVRVEQVLINDIYLAYYDTPEKQNYLQPIYVFEGSYNVDGRAGGDITIYYPAIQGQYINSTQNQDQTEESN